MVSYKALNAYWYTNTKRRMSIILRVGSVKWLWNIDVIVGERTGGKFAYPAELAFLAWTRCNAQTARGTLGS